MDTICDLPEQSAELPQILHLATFLAEIIVNGRQSVMPELLAASARYRGVTVEPIDSLLDKLQEQVSLMANVFSVRVDQQQSFRDIMSRAHAQMSQAALEALPEMVATGGPSSPVHGEQEALHNALTAYAQTYVDLTNAVTAAPQPAEAAASSVAAPPSAPAATQLWGRPSKNQTADPGLKGRIERTNAVCCRRQCELSLVLLEVDDYEYLLLTHGPDRTIRLMATVKQAMEHLCDVACECLLVSDARCAVVLPDCDRQQAVSLARSFLDTIPASVCDSGASDSLITCSVGVATLANPTRSSRPDDLIDAADRCLFAARRSGGAVVKSIDVL